MVQIRSVAAGAIAGLLLVASACAGSSEPQETADSVPAGHVRCVPVEPDRLPFPPGDRPQHVCVAVNDDGSVTTAITWAGEDGSTMCIDASVDMAARTLGDKFHVLCGQTDAAGEFIVTDPDFENSAPLGPGHNVICSFVDSDVDANIVLARRSEKLRAALERTSILCGSMVDGAFTLHRADRSTQACRLSSDAEVVNCEPPEQPVVDDRTPAERGAEACAPDGDALECDDAVLDQRSEDYWKECYSPEMAEYRQWLIDNGHSLEKECPHGHAGT